MGTMMVYAQPTSKSVSLTLIEWQRSDYAVPFANMPTHLPNSGLSWVEKCSTTQAPFPKLASGLGQEAMILAHHTWPLQPTKHHYQWCHQTDDNRVHMEMHYESQHDTLVASAWIDARGKSEHIKLSKLIWPKNGWLYIDKHHYGFLVHGMTRETKEAQNSIG